MGIGIGSGIVGFGEASPLALKSGDAWGTRTGGKVREDGREIPVVSRMVQVALRK